MAANGARKGWLSRTTPPLFPMLTCAAAPAPPSKSSLFDTSIVKDTLNDNEKQSIVLKLKKPVAKSSIPGNWKESEGISMYLSLYYDVRSLRICV